MTKIVVKQRGFHPCEYMSDFVQFQEVLPSKEEFKVN